MPAAPALVAPSPTLVTAALRTVVGTRRRRPPEKTPLAAARIASIAWGIHLPTFHLDASGRRRVAWRDTGEHRQVPDPRARGRGRG